MWLQVPNTAELLADPAYESAVLAYLRTENHQQIAKKRKSVMAIRGKVHPYPGCCLQIIPPSPVLTRLFP